MDKAMISVAAGMRARLDALDLLANNIANSSTTGYKADREFYGVYRSAEALLQSGNRATSLPSIDARWTDFSPGTLRDTGSPADLALSGRGFFAVEGSSGPLYTRNGHFQISPSGELVNTEGYRVRLAEGHALKLQSDRTFEVAADGAISQMGQVLGHIQVVTFENPERLEKAAGTYFRNTTGAAPATSEDTQVHQGRLEDSNVNPADGAIRLVSIMRQFEALQKALHIMSEMSSSEVAKVS